MLGRDFRSLILSTLGEDPPEFLLLLFHLIKSATMAEEMDLDVAEPRGTKRTAAEAGLPPEAPRRIKACYTVAD